MRYHVKMVKLLQKEAKVTKVPDDTYGGREGERERGREGERERGRERITIQNWLRSLLHSNSKRRVRIGRGKLR